jgi:cobalt-zinc-cadmium efflux system membrane fusion protein
MTVPRQLQIVAALAVAAILILGSTWGYNHWTRNGAAQTESPTAAPTGSFRVTPAQLAGLKVQTVAERPFRTEQVTEGKIALNADRTTPVFSPFSGRVTRVIAGLGDRVQSGASLAAIDASEFAQAQSDLSVAVAQLKLAQTKEQRAKGLYDAKGGSLQDWQQAQTDFLAAQTALAAVRSRLRILGKSDTQIATLEAGGTLDPLAYIVAPIAGEVTDRQVGPGQYVQAGAGTPVYTIGDLSSVWLVANVRESDAPQMRRGQAIDVRVNAFPGRIIHAKLTYVAPVIDPVTHRVAVHAEIDNHDGSLKPEMSATFTIYTSEATPVVSIPEAAIVYEADTARVWVVTAKDTLAQRQISVGRRAGNWMEVVSGLKAGEQLVTSGSLFIDRAAKPE